MAAVRPTASWCACNRPRLQLAVRDYFSQIAGLKCAGEGDDTLLDSLKVLDPRRPIREADIS